MLTFFQEPRYTEVLLSGRDSAPKMASHNCIPVSSLSSQHHGARRPARSRQSCHLLNGAQHLDQKRSRCTFALWTEGLTELWEGRLSTLRLAHQGVVLFKIKNHLAFLSFQRWYKEARVMYIIWIFQNRNTNKDIGINSLTIRCLPGHFECFLDRSGHIHKAWDRTVSHSLSHLALGSSTRFWVSQVVLRKVNPISIGNNLSSTRRVYL